MSRFPLRLLAVPLVLTAAPARADERSYMFSDFDRIRVEGPFEVIVGDAPSASVSAEGDARALDRLAVRVDGRTLVISPGVNGWGGYPGAAKTLPVVRVRGPMLRAATVLGNGRMTIDRLSGQRVDVGVSGAGSLTVAAIRADLVEATVIGSGALTVGGQALRARFRSNGPATIDAGALDVSALTVAAQGSGDGRYAARDTANIAADGQGSVTVAGTPSCTVRGSAPVSCGAAR
ncbi:DUF2807 domain-containing protein [Sphingomonas donggukensis]|uniref:DUF2807 domain-containing protein n=1 Tax=Sphingomonas donggukensis TaxID=2949093 RepID=A0ABY4TTA2_9SPHN|nr:head GIN domain-containing protein [Sphingomonas donggukensis]URW75635.1 DUF2807 domain-containing protein [Sphingomonas donggukensis]